MAQNSHIILITVRRAKYHELYMNNLAKFGVGVNNFTKKVLNVF